MAVAIARAGAAVAINDIGVSLSGDAGSSAPAEETKAEIEALVVYLGSDAAAGHHGADLLHSHK